jgi:hypothetical protein
MVTTEKNINMHIELIHHIDQVQALPKAGSFEGEKSSICM